MGGCNIQDFTIDDCALDEYGNKDSFRNLILKGVAQVVSGGRWFAFCKKATENQIDLMSIKNKNGQSMGRIIGSKYYPDTEYRSAVYKHFLRSYMCYYEVPMVKKGYDSNIYRGSYDKAIVTSNIAVISAWLDIPLEEAAEKYAMHLDDAYVDTTFEEMPYVKLIINKDGVRTIRKPRTPLDLTKQGTRVVPMFALKAGLDYLLENAQEKVVRVSFMKDGGDIRSLDFSYNRNLVREIYGESNFFFRGFEECYDGEFLHSNTVPSGYLRLIEIGGSKYDNPLRSVSFSRIDSFELDVQPDLTFVNIDMDSIVESFKKDLGTSQKKSRRIAANLVDFDIMSLADSESINSSIELESWIERKVSMLGTAFLRSLAIFMLGNPEDFPNYTGSPVEYSNVASNFGISTMDEEDEGLSLY